ncbi:MAG TPA: hypothetical protein PLS37_07925 [Propioniciclava tarda]|nr:hypothetical protein [Propioniciclava tarda]
MVARIDAGAVHTGRRRRPHNSGENSDALWKPDATSAPVHIYYPCSSRLSTSDASADTPADQPGRRSSTESTAVTMKKK